MFSWYRNHFSLYTKPVITTQQRKGATGLAREEHQRQQRQEGKKHQVKEPPPEPKWLESRKTFHWNTSTTSVLFASLTSTTASPTTAPRSAKTSVSTSALPASHHQQLRHTPSQLNRMMQSPNLHRERREMMNTVTVDATFPPPMNMSFVPMCGPIVRVGELVSKEPYYKDKGNWFGPNW